MPRPDFDLLDLPPDPACSGEPVTVFYDCEFTDLTSDSKLLSVGFVRLPEPRTRGIFVTS